jgi:hypothetical protein
LTLFCQGYLRCRVEKMWLLPLLVASATILLVLHGRELHAEEYLRGISGSLLIHCN